MGYLKAGKLTFVKYTELKNKHHERMKLKLLNNEIEYYSFDTDIFGRLDKLILVEVEVIISRERVEEDKMKAEREAKWAAEKAQKAQELAQRIAEEEAAARLARQEQKAAEEAQREAEEAVRLDSSVGKRR